MFMKSRAKTAGMVMIITIMLAGCVTPEQQAEADRLQCSQYGFKTNTDGFANCMMTINANRQSLQQKQFSDQSNYFQQQDLLSELIKSNSKKHRSHRHDSYTNESDRNTAIDTTPSFDREGNPNFNEEGQYIGCHGTGCQVDSPD